MLKRTVYQKGRKKRVWTCKYCGTVFKTKTALQHHSDNNLWEGHIRYRKGKYKCDICNAKFDTKKDFLEHWDDDHDDSAIELEFLKPSRDNASGVWRIRPTERELIKTKIKSDRSKSSLRNDLIVNDLILEEFEYGIQEMAMTVVEILGIPGVGKSVLGLTLSRHLQMLWFERLTEVWNTDRALFTKLTGEEEFYIPTVRIGFNMDQTAKHIKEARMGDVVIQDEDPALTGINSRAIQDQIQNFLKIMRKECINLIFISPIQVTYIATPTFVLETIAKDVDRRVTTSAYYDRQHNAHGWTLLEILEEEDPLMIYYLKEKYKNISRIKERSGKEGVSFEKDSLLADAEKLYQFVVSTGFDLEHKKVSLDFLKTMCIFADIKGTVKYVEIVARTLRNMLETKKMISEVGGEASSIIDVPKRFTTTNDEFVIELEDVIEDADFLEEIYNSTEAAIMAKKRRGEKDPRKFRYTYEVSADGEKVFVSKHAEAWRLVYVKGYTMEAVAESLAHFKRDGMLTDSAIANKYKTGGWRAIYQEEVSGDAAEAALKSRYYPDEEWKVVGGHGTADIVNDVDETWIEVKIRNRIKPKEPVETQITLYEFDHVREGYPLKVVRIGYVQQRCRIEFWSVKLNPEWLSAAVEEELENEDTE